jgi:hypothetical protein
VCDTPRKETLVLSYSQGKPNNIGYIRIFKPKEFMYVAEASVYSPVTDFPILAHRVPMGFKTADPRDVPALVQLAQVEVTTMLEAIGESPVDWTDIDMGLEKKTPPFIRDLVEKMKLMHGEGFDTLGASDDASDRWHVVKTVAGSPGTPAKALILLDITKSKIPVFRTLEPSGGN